MMMPTVQANKNRLFVVHSPHNALAVLSLIKEDADTGGGVVYADYAIVCDTMWYDFGKSSIMSQICMDILKAHDFAMVIDLHHIQRDMFAVTDTSGLVYFRELILDKLAVVRIDELYVIRNLGTNKIFTYLFSDASITVYGESYHKLDSSMGESFSRIDYFRTLLPVDFTNGLLDFVPLKVTRREHLLAVISDVIRASDYISDEIRALKEQIGENRVIVVCLQYLSDGYGLSLETELEYYLRSIASEKKRGNIVIIKAHPRSFAPYKARIVANALRAKGYDVINLSRRLNLLSLEIICYELRNVYILSPLSSTLLVLKYLYGIEGTMNTDDELVAETGMEYHLALADVLKNCIDNLSGWNPKENKPLYVYDKISIFAIQNKPANESKVATFKALFRNEQLTVDVARVILDSFVTTEKMEAVLNDLEINTVGIYGIGVIGKRFVDLLSQSREYKDKLYLIDNKSSQNDYRGYGIRRLDDEIIKFLPDVIINTVLYDYDSICQEILKSPLRSSYIVPIAEFIDFIVEREKLRLYESQ
jgi:hypothetical protein